jgi:hypothetical protein
LGESLAGTHFLKILSGQDNDNLPMTAGIGTTHRNKIQEINMANKMLKDSNDCMRTQISGGSAIKRVLLISLLFVLTGSLAFAGGKKNVNPLDPYQTAELEAAPVVKSEDLAYKAIIFDEVQIPPAFKKIEGKVTTYVNDTLSNAIHRLEETKAYVKVGKANAPFPEEPYLHVKCTLLDYRIVSSSSRFWLGVAAGGSYMTYVLKIYDGKNKNLMHELEITSQASAWSGMFGGQDAGLPIFLGRVLADFVILRTRTDRGSGIVPLEKVIPDDATFTGSDAKLMWAAKDNHAETSWEAAIQYAKDYRGGGYSDWRLPSDKELLTLFDRKNTIKLPDNYEIHVADQISLTGHMCWTNKEKGDKAEYIDFSNGQTKSKKKEEVSSLRALIVRDIK